MPFTPFHVGPGIAVAATTRWVDFWAFVAANVLIDLESGWNLWRHQFPVHRFLHTFLGATVMILPAAVLAFAASWVAVRASILPRRSSVPAVTIGAAFGAWSHVVLDSLMHSDMKPLAPWSEVNPFLGACSLPTLHNSCLAAGAVGLVIFAVRAVIRRKNARSASQGGG